MDQELKQQLEWINSTLNTLAKNQTLIYCKLREIESRLPAEKGGSDNGHNLPKDQLCSHS